PATIPFPCRHDARPIYDWDQVGRHGRSAAVGTGEVMLAAGRLLPLAADCSLGIGGGSCGGGTTSPQHSGHRASTWLFDDHTLVGDRKSTRLNSSHVKSA